MQRLAHLQPEMKKLQERFKGDKERMNQEMMKFYRENKVNPFASCLPMVAQFPVFISLYYMLRIDLRYDICPDDQPARVEQPEAVRLDRRIAVPVHQRPDGQGDRQHAGDPDRPLRRLAAVLDAADVDDDGQDAADDLPGAAVHLRHVRDPVPGRPARLLDHHEPVDDRAAGDHQEAPRPAASAAGGGREAARACSTPSSGGGSKPRPTGPTKSDGVAAGEGADGRRREPKGTAGRPARRSPPRKKKKRSGRRR